MNIISCRFLWQANTDGKSLFLYSGKSNVNYFCSRALTIIKGSSSDKSYANSLMNLITNPILKFLRAWTAFFMKELIRLDKVIKVNAVRGSWNMVKDSHDANIWVMFHLKTVIYVKQVNRAVKEYRLIIRNTKKTNTKIKKRSIKCHLFLSTVRQSAT